LWGVLWTLYPVTNGPLAGARFMLAAAFDRAVPAKMADVSDRFHVPVVALAAYCLLSVILGAAYVFIPAVATMTYDGAFGLIVLEIGTGLAAIILPYKSKATFDSSPVAKYKVGNVPVMSIVGAISVGLLIWIFYVYATVNALGVNSPGASVWFLVIVYASGIVLYYVAKYIRRRQGIDLGLAFRQIPPE